jgi:predicted lipid-binding transport protein (Tim44 family)
MQGIAGGLAGGLIGNMLFGGMGHAAGSGYGGGGGIGLFEIILIGLLAYFGWKFYKKRRTQAVATGYSNHAAYSEPQGYDGQQTYQSDPQLNPYTSAPGVENGLRRIGQYDPNFNEETLKEAVQDIFFRIQAAWMNRSTDGIEPMVTGEMAAFFKDEFEGMRQKGRINRLENIAVRKVEPTEAWQESGKDFVTVLITANLLDYTVDDVTGNVVEGDKLNPVKFQELWTFCRDIGAAQWKLSGINQVEKIH